jgi:hypothetical protein
MTQPSYDVNVMCAGWPYPLPSGCLSKDNDTLACPRVVPLQARRLGLRGETTSRRRGDTSRAERIASFPLTHVMHNPCESGRHAGTRVAYSPPSRCGYRSDTRKSGYELVGGTGIEPVTSSVSAKSGQSPTSYDAPPVVALAANIRAVSHCESAAVGRSCPPDSPPEGLS